MASPKKEGIEARIGESIEEYLKRELFESGRSTKEIAKELGVSVATIGNWKIDAGIKEKCDITWKTKEKWIKFGLENGFNETNQGSLRYGDDKVAKSWVCRGYTRKWTSDFEFDSVYQKTPWKTEEDWTKFGLENKLDQLMYSETSNSDDQELKSWLRKGYRADWIGGFEFMDGKKGGKVMRAPWLSYEHWKSYGIVKKISTENIYEPKRK